MSENDDTPQRVHEPDEYPFGKTESLNYDPEQVNTAAEAADLFDWLAEQNRAEGTVEGAQVAPAYEDCANLLRNEVLGDE